MLLGLQAMEYLIMMAAGKQEQEQESRTSSRVVKRENKKDVRERERETGSSDWKVYDPAQRG